MENMIDDLDNIPMIDPEMEARIKEAAELSNAITQKIQTESPELMDTDNVTFSAPAPKKKEKVNKTELVEKIMDLQARMKVPNPRPVTHFNRMNKTELEEYLGFLVNKGVNQVHGTNDKLKKQTKVTMDEEVEEPERLPSKGRYSKEWGATGLFQLNMLVIKVAEITTENFKEKLGTDLVGLSDDVRGVKDELMEILAEIYAENAESIEEYLSAGNRYALLMGGLVSQRGLANRERVMSELEKKRGSSSGN